MLNHLPVRYRVAVWIAGLVASAGTGVWLTVLVHAPLGWQSAAAIAVAVGVLAICSFLRALHGSGSDRPDGDSTHQVA